jgi:hypothetical protein
MASGHVNRIKRPNTWLHRPMLQNVKKALANSEPSTHGTFPTCRANPLMSVDRGRPEEVWPTDASRDFDYRHSPLGDSEHRKELEISKPFAGKS